MIKNKVLDIIEKQIITALNDMGYQSIAVVDDLQEGTPTFVRCYKEVGQDTYVATESVDIDHLLDDPEECCLLVIDKLINSFNNL